MKFIQEVRNSRDGPCKVKLNVRNGLTWLYAGGHSCVIAPDCDIEISFDAINGMTTLDVIVDRNK